jgi:Uma2 family endonuclease
MQKDVTKSSQPDPPPETRPTRHGPAFEIVRDAPTEDEAFLDWLTTKTKEDGRYELSRGQVTRMQAWVRRSHAIMCTNILLTVAGLLDRSKFHIASADFGVKTPVGTRFPDVMIEPVGGKFKERVARNPIFIAEVLSPSTTDVDFLEKAPEYMGIASLQTYLICSPDEPCVWVYRRGPSGWPAKPERIINDLSALIPLGGLEISLPVTEIYRGFTFTDD